MLEIAKKNGRAYKCTPCGYIGRKNRVEEHFYKKHVSEFEVPYLCVGCEFRTGDNAKFVRHQETPGHRSKVDTIQDLVALQVSTTPRHMVIGQDVLKLSREESNSHWMNVGMESEETGPATEVEDILPQLLEGGPMILTPKATEEKEIGTVEKGVQTDFDLDFVRRVEANMAQMYNSTCETLSSTFSYIEAQRKVSERQEKLLERLEKRLNQYEEKEKREERDRQERRKREDREREDRRRRDRSRERK
ncbi:MAG: hypothetical protein N0E48_20515 [Candidatus Thiodiazotropha endolucinida]|nr:hypothetical protein [Candidatus Thiodiazotropha taylori]MCW4345717.1 hypothetical protein [Candidatus Thiodiazotropha endolucinida]